jgi:1-acyl-sn-glycerol-3-phosphate acyltransferase
MIGRLIAFLVRLFTGARARWMGCVPDPKRTRVYFANHTSNLDFVLLWSALPNALRLKTRPAAALDYWSQGRVRPWIAQGVFNAILIERKHVTRDNNPITQLLDVMNDGHSIIIFPEGTRTPHSGGELGEFKSGLYHLAKSRPDAEFVPVYLENLNRVLPKGELLPVPMLCSVSFGQPLTLAPNESKLTFLERARQAVSALSLPPS